MERPFHNSSKPLRSMIWCVVSLNIQQETDIVCNLQVYEIETIDQLVSFESMLFLLFEFKAKH